MCRPRWAARTRLLGRPARASCSVCCRSDTSTCRTNTPGSSHDCTHSRWSSPPGGIAKELNSTDAAKFLATLTPTDPVAQLRTDLLTELAADIAGIEAQIKQSRDGVAPG